MPPPVKDAHLSPPPTPTLPKNDLHSQYDSAKYWDQRYSGDPGEFEWYQDYGSMKPVVDDAIAGNRAAAVLQIGVGTSELAADMVEAGGHTGSVVNVDVSRVCVEHMRGLHAHLRDKGVTYEVGDACDMRRKEGEGEAEQQGVGAAAAAGSGAEGADEDLFRRFTAEDGSFDAVVDKGTLDALLCGCGAADKAKALVSEAARVLRRGGAFLLVTFGAPERRLGHLLPDEYTQTESDDEEEDEADEDDGGEKEEGEAKEDDDDDEEKEEAAAEAAEEEEANGDGNGAPKGPYGGRQLPWGPNDVSIYVIVKHHRREDAEEAVGRPPLPPPAPTTTTAGTRAEKNEEAAVGTGEKQKGEEEDDDNKEDDEEEEEEKPPPAVIFGPLSPKDDALMERLSGLSGAHFCYVCRRPRDR